MDDSRLKNALRFDHSTSFSKDIVVEQVYCASDGNTIFVLRVGLHARVSFSIVGTDANTVLKTLFGALHGFSLHSCIQEMAEFLHDIYDVKHINISFDYEKD